MTGSHRSAHLKAVVVSAVLAAAALAHGWTARTARPRPEPLSVPATDPPPAHVPAPEDGT